jgi:hypothetical protein
MKTSYSFGNTKKSSIYSQMINYSIYLSVQFIIKSSNCNRLKSCIDNLRVQFIYKPKNEHGFYLRIPFGVLQLLL